MYYRHAGKAPVVPYLVLKEYARTAHRSTTFTPDTNCRWCLMVPGSYVLVNAVVTKRHIDASWNRIWIIQSIASNFTELRNMLGLGEAEEIPNPTPGFGPRPSRYELSLFSLKVADWPVWCINLWSFCTRLQGPLKRANDFYSVFTATHKAPDSHVFWIHAVEKVNLGAPFIKGNNRFRGWLQKS